MKTPQNPVAHYYPFDKGVYQVAPLLRPFGSAFGNPESVENKVFQIDSDFPDYHREKLRSLSTHPHRYIAESRLSPSQRRCATHFMLKHLEHEYPELIRRETDRVVFLHTGDTLLLDAQGEAHQAIAAAPEIQALGPQGSDPLVILALQIQEDFSLWTYDDSGDWMAYASICYPNHWAPEDKIGKNFFQVHEPVAEAGPMLRSSTQLVQGMVHRGPFVRFAWGVATDTRLNHHPLEPQGRHFDPQNPQLWVRAERQTLHGFPDERLSFFTIRTYFEDVAAFKHEARLRDALRAALESMTPASRVYKGLDRTLGDVLRWLGP